MRQLVVGRALDLRQAVAGGAARHIVIVHHPRGGGAAGFGGGLETRVDGFAELVGIPAGLGEIEVERLTQLVHRGIQVLVLGHHPRLGHGKARRVVLVEHLAPFAVDVVHFAAVEQRMAEVVVQHADHAVFAAELLQRLGFKVFGQTVRHVDAEAVGAVVGPEAQGFLEFLVDVRVLPVDVRLRLVEQVQIPLAVGHASPGRAAEEGLPVVGRQFAVLAAAVAEDVAVARRGAGLGGEGFLEEHVLVGGVIGHDVHDYLDAGLMRGFGHGVEVVHGAQSRVDVAVVDHVVAAVRQIGGVERGEPDGVHAEVLQVVHFLGNAGDVADAVAVNVLEAARVNLVNDGLLPPVVIEVVGGHADSFLCGCDCVAHVVCCARLLWVSGYWVQQDSNCNGEPMLAYHVDDNGIMQMIYAKVQASAFRGGNVVTLTLVHTEKTLRAEVGRGAPCPITPAQARARQEAQWSHAARAARRAE